MSVEKETKAIKWIKDERKYKSDEGCNQNLNE